MNKIAIGCLTLVLQAACASPPKIHISEFSVDNPSGLRETRAEGNQDFAELVTALRGKQFGDLIFKENSTAYLITPTVDAYDLELTAKEEAFSIDEYQARLTRLRTLHEHFLIFSLDLRLPFYAGWSQSEQLDFLKRNLVITLENGSGYTYTPQRQIFNVIERFHDKPTDFESAKRLAVRVPVRVYFKKTQASGATILAHAKEFVIKLRLKKSPPYHLGFWEDKYYQGFRWLISGNGSQASVS
ncbi:MAG: hypothetical protein ACE5IY_04235 [bacterium]